MSRKQRVAFDGRRTVVRRRRGNSAWGLRQHRDRHRSHPFESLEERCLLAFDTPLMNFEGQTPSAFLAPPDPTGYVGKDHYIQMVNAAEGSHFTVYDKETANIVLGPMATSSLAPSNTLCSVVAGGDPIVAYDHLAERWVIMEFLAPSFFTGLSDGLCVNVSQTSNPADNLWHHYFFETTNFADFPKLTVSPSAYIVTANDIDLNLLPDPNVPAAYALDRERMLLGFPAQAVRPPVRVSAPALTGYAFQSLTGSDLDGPAPADGTTAFLMRQRDDELHGGEPVTIGDVTLPFDPEHDFLEMWEFQVDFDTGSASLEELPSIPVSEFDSNLCEFQLSCLPQPLRPWGGGFPPGLDPISQIIMYRLQYRSFGSYETLVGNFTVDTDGRDHAGIRWFELRRTSGEDWQLYQEGTVAPDDHHRFMGSIAMDGSGNIALGYTVTSEYVFPSLRYTGRLASDPLGTMPQGEHVIVEGNGSQLGFSRWGDYSAMTVDPIDDSTFYFTGEYVAGLRWATRVAAMSFEDPRPVLPLGPGREISGRAWHDVNGDGIQDSGEPALEGWTIYLDLNNDQQRGIAEPLAVTNEQGSYRFRNVDPGFYVVREVVEPSWVQTFPTTANGGHRIRVYENAGPNDADFGNRLGSGMDQGTDYGDAPAPFPTPFSQNGASHTIVAGFGLGTRIDGEADGQPNASATGDDLVGDDEDGVLFLTELTPGSTATVSIRAQHGDHPPGLLQAWVDFDRDGNWTRPGEQIFRDLSLADGANVLTFSVPEWAVVGPTYARFRYGYEPGISFTGQAVAGEVEDHLVEILRIGPTAVDDVFTVRRNTSANLLDVTANDIIRASTGTQIVSTSDPSQGGAVSIAEDGLSLLYTPPQDFDGTDTFSYTLQDQDGEADSADVQVVIPPDLVAIRLRAADLDGTPLTQVDLGQEFLLQGYVQDLRKTAATGVFAAYLDVEYPARAATVTGQIVYGPEYGNGKSGDTSIPGLIDEVGAFDGEDRLGPNERLLFQVPVEPTLEGPLTFTANPAEQLPLHHVLLFDVDSPIPQDRVEYAPLTVLVGLESPVLQTNPRNPLDVNDDSSVSPIDALLVINELNADSSAPAARAAPSIYLDVSADGALSPLDALLVINELNRNVAVAARAPLDAVAAALSEEVEAEPLLPPNVQVLSTPTPQTASPTCLASEAPFRALFADTDRNGSDLAESADGEALEDVLDLIGDDVAGKQL